MDSVGVKEILETIDILIKPKPFGKSSDLEGVFANNIKLISELNCHFITNLELVKSKCNLKVNSCCALETYTCWDYVCICLEALLLLKCHLERNESELLSILHQKCVKNVFELIISMGLLPYLLHGVGFDIDLRCPSASKFKHFMNISAVSDINKYRRLCIVTRGLLSVIEEKSMNSIFLSKHVEDLFAALCQLTMPQFKQPTPDLILDRDYFLLKFKNIISSSYQPMVVNALMILQGNKESPRWLRLGVSKLLTQRLLERSGVISIVRAIQFTADYENPNVVTRLESIARLIITPHTKDKALYFSVISPQIIELIQSDDYNLVRIGVLCCRVLYESNIDIYKQYISSVLMAPLLECASEFSENEITQSIQSLNKCFSGEMWSVPVEAAVSLSNIIYLIYSKICDSALVIKKPVEELLWFILSSSSEECLSKIFRSFLLNESFDEIRTFPDGVIVSFGDEGGIKIKISDSESSDKIEYSKCILKLLEENDTSGRVTKKLFLILLNYYSTLNSELSEMKLFVTELLADLAETERIQKNIIDDSQSIITFIEVLVQKSLLISVDVDIDTELLCTALVLLLSMANDLKFKNFIRYNLKNLSALLAKLSLKTKSIELKILCDEVCNIILSKGVIGKTINKNQTLTEAEKNGRVNYAVKSKSRCEVALEEACHPLLPVRGHAIMELTKLISSRDSEAMAKKNGILCVFQENLKNEDSYIYLSAVEGMASLVAQFPDTVLVSLIEEYSSTETIVRLKVGEILMRVVRRLGDMVPVYKNELLNSCLSGVRDTDSLVRASSLSNIGEVCRLLSFRIGPIAAEVFNCVESVVATDPAPEPRRSAVMLLTLLLRGLQKQALNVLEPVLAPLYRTLKKIYQVDKDDIVKLHAQLAIEELNSATLSFLFPTETLSKHIFVLDPPL